jgi:hypothetical protein
MSGSPLILTATYARYYYDVFSILIKTPVNTHFSVLMITNVSLYDWHVIATLIVKMRVMNDLVMLTLQLQMSSLVMTIYGRCTLLQVSDIFKQYSFESGYLSVFKLIMQIYYLLLFSNNCFFFVYCYAIWSWQDTTDRDQVKTNIKI